MSEFEEPCVELLELEIDHYKNLESLRTSWRPRTVLYGPNASGKTNLLEALALLFGSRATLWQVAGRAAVPDAGKVSAVVRATDRDLPLGPVAPQFLSLVGSSGGTTWEECVRRTELDQRLIELLVDVGRRPILRYRLETISGLEEASAIDRGRWVRDEYEEDASAVCFERQFAKTLLMPEPLPEWLLDLAPELPDVFAPLRTWIARPPQSRSVYAELMELPPASSAPVRMVWMASERTASEAWFDLSEAYEAAVTRVVELGYQLDRLLFRPDREVTDDEPRQDGDVRFWLVYRAAVAANATLRQMCPGISIELDDEYPGSLCFELSSADHRHRRRINDPSAFSVLSSGQRAWFDIALANAAAELETVSGEAEWINLGLGQMSDEELLALAAVMERSVDALHEGYWSADDIDVALQHAKRVLGTARRVLGGYGKNEDHQRVFEYVFSANNAAINEAIRGFGYLRAFDEPERHLHPSSQRRVAQALQSAIDDAGVVLSTHSHYFLGAPGWLHLHLTPTLEGPIVSAFEMGQLRLANAITREMGLGHGELLSRVRYVLFVEGIVDRDVLQILYGPVLNEAGVLVLPIHGIEEVAALAELELIGEILDIHAGVLADHVQAAKLGGIASSAPLTKEERALLELRRKLRRRGRNLDIFGLVAEDVLAYLDEDVIREVVPTFPGWAALRSIRQHGENLKQAAERATGERFGRRLARSCAETMRSRSLGAGGDLPGIIAQVVVAAQERTAY